MNFIYKLENDRKGKSTAELKTRMDLYMIKVEKLIPRFKSKLVN